MIFRGVLENMKIEETKGTLVTIGGMDANVDH